MTFPDPCTWYTIGMAAASGGFQTVGFPLGEGFDGDFVLMGDPGGDQNFIDLPFMFVPVDNGQYAIYIAPNSTLNDGLCLMENITLRNCPGPVTTFSAYDGSMNAHYSVSDNGDGTVTIQSSATESLLASYNMNGQSFGPFSFGGPFCILMSEASGGYGGALVSTTFQLTALSAHGNYPTSLGPVQQQLPFPPKATSWNTQLPVRVPADPSQDPVWGEVTVPFFTVADPGMSLAQQMTINPYYRMRHTRFWSQTSDYSRSAGPSETYTSEDTVGMTATESQSMTSTTSMTVMADGGIAFENLAGSVSATIEQSLVVEKTNTSEQMTSDTVTHQFDFQDGEAGVISFYALTHAFETFRGDGTSIGRWTMSNSGDLFEDAWSSGGAPPSSPLVAGDWDD